MTAASRPVLEVMTASTRPGRGRRSFGDWFIGVATEHGVFEVVDVDLAVVAFPFLDEPHHPKLGRYVQEHAKQWSATVPARTRSSSQLKQVVTTLHMVPVFEAVSIPFAA